MTEARADDAGLAGLVAWIEAETGLCFPEVHHETIRKAASRRCSELGLPPESYEAMLSSDHGERTRFLDRILIGETYFFRDERQFRVLVDSVLPCLLEACRDAGRELLLWSATCATGEEAISLAAAAEEARAAQRIDVAYRVTATDLNAGALAGLVSGRFPLSSFRTDGRSCHALLDRCGRREGDWWQADEAVLRRIEARHLNILTGKPFAPRTFDLALFRNTLVYMRQDRKDKAVSRIAEAIRPGGFLFLASPEVPSVRHPLLDTMESDGVFYFSRREAPAPPASAAPPPSGTQGRSRSGSEPVPAAPRLPTQPRPRSAAAFQTGRTATASVPAADVEQSRLTRIGATDLAIGLSLASRWMLDPAARSQDVSPEAAREAARAIEDILAAVHVNDGPRADALIDGLEARAGESHVSQYLRGLVARSRGQEAEAIEYWERSRTYDPRFWPALFQAGTALERDDPERGRPVLVACIEAIRAETDPNGFAVLLDGFNSSYYRRMAERLLARSRGR